MAHTYSHKKEKIDFVNQFDIIFDSLAIGISIISLDGTFRKVNRSLTEILGYDKSEFINKHFNQFTHPNDKNIGVDVLKKLQKQKHKRILRLEF